MKAIRREPTDAKLPKSGVYTNQIDLGQVADLMQLLGFDFVSLSDSGPVHVLGVRRQDNLCDTVGVIVARESTLTPAALEHAFEQVGCNAFLLLPGGSCPIERIAQALRVKADAQRQSWVGVLSVEVVQLLVRCLAARERYREARQ